MLERELLLPNSEILTERWSSQKSWRCRASLGKRSHWSKESPTKERKGDGLEKYDIEKEEKDTR